MSAVGPWLRAYVIVMTVFILAPLVVVVIAAFNSAEFAVFPPPGLSLRLRWPGHELSSARLLQVVEFHTPRLLRRVQAWTPLVVPSRHRQQLLPRPVRACRLVLLAERQSPLDWRQPSHLALVQPANLRQ